MNLEKSITAGFFSTLRIIGAAGIELLHNRMRLFSAELQTEKFLIFKAVLCAAAIASFGTIALVLITLAILLTYWEQARVPALFALALIYGGITVRLFLGLRKNFANHVPFGETLRGLREDELALTGRGPSPSNERD
jgi:uncharacterized membrane protein YqjE